MALTYGSVCSGIEAPTVAWHELGWQPIWFAEIESFPSALLEHYYPTVPNLGDMTKIVDKIRSEEIEAPDILIGGTPCQAFSVAGLRNSLNDDRGQLTLAFIELANVIDEVRKKNGKEPVIIIWENVPGVLSTKDNAFGCFLGALAGENCELEPAGTRWKNAGFLFGPERAAAWRILNAEFFGVPQRRRRVFVVGSARDGFRPEQILFEFDGVRRDSAPIRSTRKEIARALRNGTKNANRTRSWISHKDPIGTLCKSDEKGVGNQSVEDGKILFDADVIFNTNSNHENEVEFEIEKSLSISTKTKPLNVFGFPGNWIGRKPENGGNSVTPSLERVPCLTRTDVHGVSYQQNSRDEVRAVGGDGSIAGALTSKQGMHNQNFICDGVVRRLTPLECERLQGFPDNYTLIPYRGKSLEKCPDTKRYAALGNSMAVPVMKWIGTRIDKYLNGEL
ncbi:DNA cytosine methyltransferase [Acinetobacter seifertii]|uniref:DNA cytosine methyltransferase n=1 Tax=Acinetobacter seifertii TaxID=1530123 RepID=UPI00190672F1|nr:DNA cytosine methyltransferase [Acinetobacter seifertii]MBJ9425178.1 DNA cytosine methyltransferase [Acinetobacter seifertii]